MSNLGVTWTKLYQDAKDIFGEDLDETKLIRSANRLIDDLKLILNTDAQVRVDYIPYVYEFERYQLPDDFKSGGQISLRYDDQIDNNRNRTYTADEPPFEFYNTHWRFRTPEKWNERLGIDEASIVVDKGVEKLWLSNGRGSQTSQEISDCDSLTGWTGAGGAGNLTLDDAVKAKGNYSINFDLTAATAATLTLVLDAVDLSEYENRGVLPFDLWLPSAPSSIDIEVGETSAKYYSQNITTQSDGSPFSTSNMNEVKLAFENATGTGSPDMSSETHFKVTLNFDSATTDTDFRIDNIKAWKPEYLPFEYYSFYMVLNEDSEWAEYLTDGTDESINILPEWRKPFFRGLIVEELRKQNDERAEEFENYYNNWFREIQKRYPNRAKRVGSSWW